MLDLRGAPLACREYLVVSSAENCARPTVDSIKPVPIVVRVAKTLRALNVEKNPSTPRWVALILALEQAEADAGLDEVPPQPGPALVRKYSVASAGGTRGTAERVRGIIHQLQA